MFDILAVTGPIFLAIGAGALSTRAGLFSQDDLRVMGRFVINLALPCLLFDAVARQRFGDILNGSYLLAYAAGSLATLALGYAWARRVAHQPPTAATYMAMGMCCSNSGYVGFPILLLALPGVAGTALALNVVVENFLMIPIVLALAERERGAGGRWHQVVGQSLQRLAINPLVIGLALGVLFSLFEWRLPAPAGRTVTLFGQASSVLSLFIIGGTLAAASMRGVASKAATVVAGKLLVHPLMVTGALALVAAVGMAPLPRDLHAAAILLAGMPMMGIYPLLAMRHGHERMAAAALLGATVASFLTLNAMLWALRHGIAG
jgi:malonate transporter and related proteins